MTKQKFDYKSALEEIQQLVADIEDGSLDVDQLAKKVKRAAVLLTECQTRLKDTEATLDDILKTIS